MSAEGISTFYGANTVETAIEEIKDPSKTHATVAIFENLHDMQILDLTKVNKIFFPSLFDEEQRENREPILFLKELTKQLIRPIEELKAIEYIPTQIVAEYFHFLYKHRNKGIDGIAYKSSKTKDGICYVLFYNQEQCLPSTNTPQMLQINMSSLQTYKIQEKEKKMNSKTFVKEWVKRGDIEREKISENEWIFAFFCYFIAFNYLYSRENNGSNRNQIKSFLTTEKNVLCDFSQNLIINKKLISSEYYKTIVRDDRLINGNAITKYNNEFIKLLVPECTPNDFNKLVENKTIPELFDSGIFQKKDVNLFLFLSIYQVRCNLFHGNKCINDSRNKNLIKDGAKILGAFLDAWLNRN